MKLPRDVYYDSSDEDDPPEEQYGSRKDAQQLANIVSSTPGILNPKTKPVLSEKVMLFLQRL